jgi:hypothetical protein
MIAVCAVLVASQQQHQQHSEQHAHSLLVWRMEAEAAGAAAVAAA